MLYDWYTPRYLRGRIRALKLNKRNRVQQIRELNLVLANPEVASNPFQRAYTLFVIAEHNRVIANLEENIEIFQTYLAIRLEQGRF